MLVEVELRQILRSRDMAAIVLVEKGDRQREFPVHIGPFEASALEWAVNKLQAPRPQTHDLILNVIKGMHGALKRIIIDNLLEDEDTFGQATFYGKLDIELKDETTVRIDSRPSDSIVLACKCDVPIFVDERVFAQLKEKPHAEEEEEQQEE